MKTIALERIAAPTRTEFEKEILPAGRPVILTGALEHWPARHLWSARYLRERIGARRVLYRHVPENIYPDLTSVGGAASTSAIPPEVGRATFSDYLDRLLHPDGSGFHYCLCGDMTMFWEDGRQNPSLEPLMSDFSLPPYFDADALQCAGFWVSTRGVNAWLHYDSNSCHNLNAQVSGSKKVRLIDPDQGQDLYPFVASRQGPFNFSQVDVRQPDLQRFPNFSRVTYHEGQMHPGDLLLIPSFWHHTFEHVGEFNTNITFQWYPKQLTVNATSLQWCFVRAMLRSLSDGRPCKPNRYRVSQLPPEMRAFCAQMEEQIMLVQERPDVQSSGPHACQPAASSRMTPAAAASAADR